MLIISSRRTAICQLVAEVFLSGVAPMEILQAIDLILFLKL